ncbi:MAG: TonB-dependent receptor [bacterium]
MRRNKNSIIIKSFLLLFLCSIVNVFAGTTGKISGKVTDAATGEPLIGVNVVIEGTSLGAATDFEGEYYILNISPGVYTVKASYIGYNGSSMEGVRVKVDLTTKVDFQLSSTAIQIGEEITVVGQRIIQKDLTSSERSFQSDQINDLPVRDVATLLSLQAGVTRDAEGAIHIRGGRSSEISYMVDGVQVVNPVNRSSGISIDDQSIEELKAITGTFNAEYGQALSGVVNIVTKKGSDKFTINATGYFGDHLSFDDDIYYIMSNRDWAVAAANALVTETGRINYDYSKHGINSVRDLYESLSNKQKPWQTKESYLNNYEPFNHYDFQVNLSGPIPILNNKISYFIAGRYQNQPGVTMGRRYFMPWGLWSPILDTTHTYEMPDGELTNLDCYKGYSGQGKIFFNFNELLLSYGIYYNSDHSYSGGQKYLPDGGRHYYTDRQTHILSATYVFSNSTFLDFKGSYYQNDHKNYLYEDPFDYRYVPTQGGDFEQYMFDPSREDDIEVKGNTADFSFWGNDVNRGTQNTKYFSASLDLTSQLDKYNMIKVGASTRIHDIAQDGYALQFSQVTYRPIVPSQSSAYRSFITAKPMEFAAYVQDKIEFQELIINFGLRFDYFDSDGKLLADPKDPQIYSPFKMDHIYSNYSADVPLEDLVEYTPEQRAAFWWKKPEAKFQFSPRFGLSFPITAEGVIHFSYGHFFQNPEFQYLYANPNFWITGAGSQNLVGNADLNAERTIMYELGLQQQLFDDLYLHITGFYRDIRDWVGTGFPVDTYRGTTYYSYVNKDHAVAKGITLSTQYHLGDFWINLDYTYMEAKGTSSNSADAYNDLSAGRAPRVQLINLNWDQPHQLNLIVNYSKDGWTGTMIGTINSGFPYTPTIARGEATGSSSYTGWRENIERRPSTFNIDLRLSKMFRVGSFDIQALLDITNLLDTRNANYVYSDTGLPDYTLDDYQSWTRLLEISNSTEYYTNPGYYTAPRYISLGFRISYN